VWISATLFDQDDDGIVVVLEPEVPAGQEDKAASAVKLCPSGALRLLH
jgi:ferredoxin